MSIDQALRLGTQHQDAGRLAEAETIYRQILGQQPNHAPTLRMAGLLAFQVGRKTDALELVRNAVAADPSAAEYHSNLGVILASLDRLDEAIGEFRKALALAPSDPQAMTNLANAVQEQRKFDEAISLYRQALAIRTDIPESHHNLAKALLEKGLADEAAVEYRQAIALRPSYADAYNNLGNALQAAGKSSDAIAVYRAGLAVKPDFPEAYSNLGNVLLETSRPDEAIECFRRALELRPDYADAHNNLGNALKESGRLDEALEHYRKAADLTADYRMAGNLLYVMHFHPDFGSRAIYQAHARWNDRFAKPLAESIRPHQNDRTADRRLKIGYVSPDFREHPVGRFMLPLMEHHDHERFEIFCYTDLRNEDSLTQQLKSHADVRRTTFTYTNEQLADMVRSDKIDILVDLTMHMKGSRLGVFARKPAPVQVTYLAYCSTTGLETIDYRFSDPHLDPADFDTSVYSEKTYRLPRTYWCYPQPANSPPVGPLPARRNGFITFGSFNNYSKVTTKTWDLWLALLTQVPTSRLVLHAHEGSHRQFARDRLREHGLDPSRLAFNSFAPLEMYLEQYNQIDIALDPFPYGGGTTTCDALWMGVPLVTLRGQTAVSRSGFSILSNIGHPELVAGDERQYIDVACDLSSDLDRLESIRQSLRQKLMRSPIMNPTQFARDVEESYRRMWESYDKGNQQWKNEL